MNYLLLLVIYTIISTTLAYSDIKSDVLDKETDVKNNNKVETNIATKNDKKEEVPILKNIKNRSGCNVSGVSIPLGSDSPIMSFKARFENEEVGLVAMKKKGLDELVIENQEMVHTDKGSNSVWLKSSKTSDKMMTRVKDAFSLCRRIYNDYLSTGKLNNLDEEEENESDSDAGKFKNLRNTGKELEENKNSENKIKFRVKETSVDIKPKNELPEGMKKKVNK